MAAHRNLQAHKARPYLPKGLPEDLRWQLLDTMSYESCNPQDIWETVRKWMIT